MSNCNAILLASAKVEATVSNLRTVAIVGTYDYLVSTSALGLVRLLVGDIGVNVFRIIHQRVVGKHGILCYTPISCRGNR